MTAAGTALDGDRRTLGTTDVAVTRLGLGLAPIGGLFTAVADDTAAAAVDRAWDLGVRLFDTAPLYGHGRSEERAGRALAGRPRAAYALSTKVGRLLVPDPDAASGDTIFAEVPPVAPVFDFSYDGVLRSHEESLERLGLDRVDIALVHDPDDHMDEAVDGAWRALRELREQGRVRAIGAGMNQAAALLRFVEECDPDVLLLAGRYTLLDRCARSQVSVLLGGALNSGVLADPRPGATYDYAPAGEEVLARAQHLERVCAAHGVPLVAAALQFPLGHPAVASVVLGARSPEEVDAAVSAVTHPVPAALWTALVDEGLLPGDVPLPAGAA